MRFPQDQSLGHDLGGGVQAEEKAEALVAAEFAEAKAVEPEEKAEQDQCEQGGTLEILVDQRALACEL